MIVKDEAATLERNLAAARPFVDRMVIVDTGSTDGTVGIAKQYADIVKCIDWPDSFSEARNVSLDLAKGDYVMYLDGDEVIPEPEHWRNIRRKLRMDDPDALAIQIHNELPSNQILSGDKVMEVRIFRCDPDVRFRGRVHNQIVPAIQEAAGPDAVIEPVQAVSKHIGYSYSKEELVAKYQKRIPLIEAEIEGADNAKWEHYYRYQLMNGLFMLRDFERCYGVLQSIDTEVLTEENEFSVYLMGVHVCLHTKMYDEADVLATNMIELWGQEPISMYMKSLTQLRLGRYNAATSFGVGAIHVAQVRPNMRYNLDLHYIAASVGESAVQCNDLATARRMFRYHLEEYSESEKVREVLDAINGQGS